jgi:hypothetical protein
MRTLTSSFNGGKCYNPNLGLVTKVRVCKGAGQMGRPIVTFHAPGGVGECEEWTPTLPSELPLWTFESSENDCRDQNPLDWRITYINEKLLEHKFLKWARMTHLDTSNTSYGQKKGWESNCQFDSQPLKVKNRPNFLGFWWHATYIWKALNEGYNFSPHLISIRGLHTKLWAPKVVGIPTLGILGLPFGSPGTKWHLDVGPVAKHKVYYKGGGLWWVLWICVCLWFVCAPKVLQLCTNQFVVWFVQVCVSN